MKKINALLLSFVVLPMCHLYSQETSTLTDTRDGKVYKTMKIGAKWWMSENLNYEAKDNCWCYNDDTTNCVKYGRLYTWKISKKVCPEGWHSSNLNDWYDLETTAGLKKDQFNKNGFRGTHSGYLRKIEFIGNYAGLRDPDGKYMDKDIMINFWTKDEFSASGAVYHMMNIADSSVLRDHTNKKFAFSVRCVKD